LACLSVYNIKYLNKFKLRVYFKINRIKAKRFHGFNPSIVFRMISIVGEYLQNSYKYIFNKIQLL